MRILSIISPGKVRVSREGVESFNRAWPASPLRSSRAYWFEFDTESLDLIDTDCPESDDGPAASAMAEDCREFLRDGTRPEWAPESEPIGYADCGCCDHYHPETFGGDCRDDSNRFTADELDERHGPDGWSICNPEEAEENGR
jgi:hypothetical protein